MYEIWISSHVGGQNRLKLKKDNSYVFLILDTNLCQKGNYRRPWNPDTQETTAQKEIKRHEAFIIKKKIPCD